MRWNFASLSLSSRISYDPLQGSIGQIMTEVKRQISRSYDEYFMSALKDTDRAAAYIEAVLEPEDSDTELLRAALKDVIDSRSHANALSEEAKLKWEKLDKMLQERGSDEIYALAELLEALGFRLAVTLK